MRDKNLKKLIKKWKRCIATDKPSIMDYEMLFKMRDKEVGDELI